MPWGKSGKSKNKGIGFLLKSFEFENRESTFSSYLKVGTTN
jgi:hypothetical protein